MCKDIPYVEFGRLYFKSATIDLKFTNTLALLLDTDKFFLKFIMKYKKPKISKTI